MSLTFELDQGVRDQLQETHELKTHPPFFDGVRSWPLKPYEVRVDDRGFKAGDLLHLREWDPLTGRYTGWQLLVRVSSTLRGAPYVPDGYVLMGLHRPVRIWFEAQP